MVTTVLTGAKRAVCYRRVSSKGQTGERHSSLETQEARYIQFCTNHNYVPVKTFEDVVSGRRDDRREYLRMVDFVKQGGADVVVVQFLDRFGRNPKEILRRYWDLEDHGVSVEATDEDIKEELLLLIKAGIAGAESRRTSERVRSNMSRAVAKGVHAARPPFGLRKDYEGKDFRWEIDPVEVTAVREMYRLAVEENLGYKAIGDRISDAGHKTRNGRPFASFTVQRILGNEALIGTLAYGKRPRKGNPAQEIVRVEGFFPAILAREEWDRLQERIAIRRESSRGKTHASDYLLSGIIRCGHCGGPMAGKVGALRKGKRYRNYWCTRAMKSKANCAYYNGHSAPKLERAILEYLGQFSDPKLVRQHIEAASKREISRKSEELKETEKGLREIESQFLSHLGLLQRQVLNEEEFGKANESIRGQKAVLQEKQSELAQWLKEQQSRVSSAEKMPAAIKSFVKDFGAMEVRLAKAHLQEILKAAYIYRDDRIEIEFRG